MPSVRAFITVLAMAMLGLVTQVIGGAVGLVVGVAAGLWSFGILVAVVVVVRLGEAVERARQPR